MKEAEGWYGTLPKSWRETKLVTNVKEKDLDDSDLKVRQNMVASMSPRELGAIKGPGDFPMPKLFKSRSRSRDASEKKR